MATGYIDFDADLSGAAAALGTINGLSTQIDTAYHADAAVELAHAWMQRDFDEFMDVTARTNEDAYHHVYEFGMIGVPGGRLWDHKLVGFGGNRIATFNFKPTKVPVPRPDDESWPASESGKKLSSKRYWFFWKAPVMESGQTISYSAKPGGMLLIPLNGSQIKDPERRNRETSSKEFIFTEHVVNFRPGGDVAGNFTAAWTMWWSTLAESTFATKVKPRLEKDARDIQRIGMRRNLQRYGVMAASGKSRTSKNISVIAVASAKEAEALLLEKDKAYKREAQSIVRE